VATMTTAKKPKPKGKPGRPAADPLYAGRVMGKLTLVMRTHTKDGLMWICNCSCGMPKCLKRIKVRPQYLVRPAHPKRSCGADAWKDANPYPREKGIWQMMHQRTENPTHVSYKEYGGRGIKVCDEWNKKNPEGWKNFIEFIGPAPSKRHTIDRVNPNLGYQPYQEDGVTPQVRWATPKEQANNQRRHWNQK
jgi:hypothetical protein